MFMFAIVGTLILSVMFLPFLGLVAVPVAALTSFGTWFLAAND